MMVIVKVKKIGGSFMARIPIDAVKELGIKEGEEVQLDVKKPRKSFFGVYKGTKYSPFTEEDRFDYR